MSAWRSAGLNYVNYSNIAAQVLRNSLKGAKKDEAHPAKAPIRYFYWVNGEMMPAGQKPEVDKTTKTM